MPENESEMPELNHVVAALAILIILLLVFRMAVLFYFEAKKQFVMDLIEKAKELKSHGKEKG